MADNELVIRISGEVKDFQAALELAKEETEDLGRVLQTISKTAAVAFAALTAEIGFSIHAYGEAEAATKRLTLALQNQGIYSDKLIESYRGYATALSETTGIDDDAIVRSQAIAQGYLGQTKITAELTTAIADLAETMGGDLDGAAVKIAKSISTSTNAFAREGLVISDTATTAERYARVLEFVKTKAGGLAEESAKGVGSVKLLRKEFNDLQEDIGKEFAPAFEAAVKALTNFFKILRENKELTTFIASAIAGAAAISGILVVLPQLVNGFLILKTALGAMNIVLTATRLALYLIGGATGIGILISGLAILGTYLLSTNKSLEDFKKNLPEARAEIAKLKKELDSLESPENVSKGFNAAEEERKKKLRERIVAIQEATAEEEKLDKQRVDGKAALADKVEADNVTRRKREIQAQVAHQDALQAQVDRQSSEFIASKEKEASLLQQIAASQNEQEAAALTTLYERQRQISSEQFLLDQEQNAEFEQIKAETDAALNEQQLANTTILNQQELDAIKAQALGKQAASQEIAKQELLERVKANNTYLIEQKKFGTAYAEINKFMHSAVYQGSKQAFGELAELQQSSNATLKSIGKAAAIANIIMKTSESAMNIFAGFSASVPPPAGPILGAAGAAAAVAFGAEKLAQVRGAAKGGLMTGGIPGMDSIPAILTPGEVVAPERNFEEVIGSVRAGREAQKFTGGGGGDNSEIVASLQSIDSKLSQPAQSTTVIQGDIMADDTYIDTLVRKISDALEFRNGRIYGVNA